MAETVNIPPIGAVPKKYAIAGGGAIVLGFAYYLRKRQEDQKAASIAAAGANTGIDPATGYLFGSPEDAAALANQGAYVNPTVGTGGGGTVVSNVPGNGLPQGFTSNAAWSQYVVNYMLSNSLVQDTGPLTDALGRYLDGMAPKDDNELSLINQATAFAGYPPISAADGYPPHIRTTPTGTTPQNTYHIAARNGNLKNVLPSTRFHSWNDLARWAYWWDGHSDPTSSLNGLFGSLLAHDNNKGGLTDPSTFHNIILPETLAGK